MAWSIPSLQNLVQRTSAAFDSNLPGVDSSVWPSNVFVAARVFAGRLFELFLRQEEIADQAFVLTATGNYLDRHAAGYGISRLTTTQSDGNLIISESTAGVQIPTGTQWSDTSGNVWVSTSSVTVDSSGAAIVPIEASTAGSGQEVDGGELMSMLTIITGVNTTAVTSTQGLGGGEDIESDDALRARVLFRMRYPPHAGTEADYRRFAKENSGVTRAWASGRAYGAGTVGVWFTMDNTYADGIPATADVTTVQAYIDALRPATANVIVAAPTSDPLLIEIKGLSPNTQTVQDAVKAELQYMLHQKAEVSTLAETQYIRRSWIWQAVSNATGERYHEIVIPAEDYPIPVGYLPTYDESLIVFSN